MPRRNPDRGPLFGPQVDRTRIQVIVDEETGIHDVLYPAGYAGPPVVMCVYPARDVAEELARESRAGVKLYRDSPEEPLYTRILFPSKRKRRG